ncbi:MAG: isoprenylcysteine carboxylmethyltransferase family protein [Bacteroidota bacterium]
MALVNSFEKSGNFLFKHRGQIPVILFIMAVPVIFFTDISKLVDWQIYTLNVFAVVLSVFGFLFRAYAIGTTPKGTSGRNTQNQVAESLNTTGIYSIVRHPLYVGNYFMWIGIVMFTYNVYFVAIVSLLFWLYYERIMYAEERFLERKFGEKYMNWTETVPAFIPSFKIATKSAVHFSMKTILRREYAGVFATVFGFAFVDYLRFYLIDELNGPILRTSLHVLVLTGILTLILRTLKHNTKLLSEEDRS